jgi:hypothetical protein
MGKDDQDVCFDGTVKRVGGGGCMREVERKVVEVLLSLSTP